MPTQNVSESQTISASGTITDIYVITYQVPGHDTVVTFNVPRTGDVIADAQRIRDQIVAEVDALYSL